MPNRRGAAVQRVRVAAPNSDDDLVRQQRQRDAARERMRDARGRFTRPAVIAWPVDPTPHEVLVPPNGRVEPGDVFFRQGTMDYVIAAADQDVVVRNANGEICLSFNYGRTHVQIDQAGGGYEWRLQRLARTQQFIGTRLEPAPAELPLDPATGEPYTQDSYQAYRAERQRLRALEMSEHQRQVEEQQRAAAERQREAKVKAEALLEAVLSPQEYVDFCGGRPLAIKGSAGGDYTIRREGLSGNIRQLVDGKHVRTFCVHPHTYDHVRGAYIPDADGYVAQILGLRADEPGVLRETIITWCAPGWSWAVPGNRHHH